MSTILSTRRGTNTDVAKTESVEEMVYRSLRKAIVSRSLAPGTQITETRVAEELGVSRTPVRSALKVLAHEGLVEVYPNRGAFVAQPSTRLAEEIFQVRTELEGLAARLAAGNLTEEVLSSLKELLRHEKRSYEQRDLDYFIRTNDEIHLTIARASGNSVLATYVEQLVLRSNIYLIFYDAFYTTPLEKVRSTGEHARIVRALEARDPASAEDFMKQHVGSTLKGLRLDALKMFRPIREEYGLFQERTGERD